MYHGGNWRNGSYSGEFAFGHAQGQVNNENGSRLYFDYNVMCVKIIFLINLLDIIEI